MFDLGWTELLVVGVVALIVVGPKDLPGMFRTLGRFTAKAKGMAREFQRAMEDAADESGMKDAAKDLKSMTDPKKMGLDAVTDAVDKFEKWQPPIPGAGKTDQTTPEFEQRAEAARKIHENAKKKAEEQRAAEAAEDATEAADTAPAKTTPEDTAGKTDA